MKAGFPSIFARNSARISIGALFLAASFGPARGGEVAFFYAMDADLAALQNAGSSIGSPRQVAGQSVATVRVGGHLVRAVRMGSGCVQTAVTAAAVLARFHCDLAISSGPAGRLSDEVAIAEWVRVTEVVSYEQGSQTSTGFAAGQNALHKLDDKWPEKVPEQLAKCRAIRLASGEKFVASGEYRAQLHGTTEALGVDMNLSGLALACAEARVPLLAWKVISDSANDSASADFQAFVRAYRGEGGRLAGELIEKLPADPNDPATHSNLKALLDSAPDAQKAVK